MQGPLLAILSLVFIICLIGFTSTAGQFQNWTTSSFSELGTFLGGLFGPVALLLAVLQFSASERANRASNKIEIEERHRADLRNSIERKSSKLDQSLDELGWLTVNGKEFTLRTLLGTAVSRLPGYEIPDFKEFSRHMTDHPKDSFPANDVLLLERCAHISISLNQLKALCQIYDRISGNNFMSEEIRSSYAFPMNALLAKNYPLERWE